MRTASLYHCLEITRDGVTERYALAEIAPQAQGIHKCWELVKRGQKKRTVHHVSLGVHGCRCDCGAYCWRRTAGECKHLLSLRAVGLLPKEQK